MIHPIGHVYLIHCIGTTYYKIGMARSIQHRLGQLKGANPHELVVIDTIRHPNYKRIEQRLHDLCKAYRVRYEWYDFDEDTLSMVRNVFQDKQHPFVYSKHGWMEVQV